jgi:hypothetical protein
VFERESFRDIQPMPEKYIKSIEDTKEGENERIGDGKYTMNTYFSSKYAQNYK